MAPTVEWITDVPSLNLGEGPHWDIATQSLYFVDILGKSINRYTPSTGQHTQVKLEKQASIIIPVKGKENQFVVAIEKEIVIITWDGQSETVSKIDKIVEVGPETNNNLNDGKCDSKGRLWIGTADMARVEPRSGILSLLDGQKISTQVNNVGCSNGLAWNKQDDKFYYIDTFKDTVDAFDFDLEKGISNRTSIFTPSKHGIQGRPDGMTIDEDDNLWVAVFGGSCVLKIDPRKPETLLDTVKIPAEQVTSVAWGGVNVDELYVTTGRFIINNRQLSVPNNGSIYRVTNLGTKGLPAVNFAL